MRDPVKVRISVYTEHGHEAASGFTLDRDAVEAVIQYAAGNEAPEMRHVELFVHDAVRRSLLEWARVNCTDRIQRLRDEREIGPLTAENLSTQIQRLLRG